MLTRFAITRRADDDGVDASVVERDYVLAHIVANCTEQSRRTWAARLRACRFPQGLQLWPRESHDAGYPKAFAPRVALTRLH